MLAIFYNLKFDFIILSSTNQLQIYELSPWQKTRLSVSYKLIWQKTLTMSTCITLTVWPITDHLAKLSLFYTRAWLRLWRPSWHQCVLILMVTAGIAAHSFPCRQMLATWPSCRLPEVSVRLPPDGSSTQATMNRSPYKGPQCDSLEMQKWHSMPKHWIPTGPNKDGNAGHMLMGQ